MMNILIAGGSGFIGNHLTRELIARGHSVAILSRRSGDGPMTGSRLISWDGRTPGEWVREVGQADAIINLAGESIGGGRWTKARKARILESRIHATEALVAAFRVGSPKSAVLINASGVDYYGHVPEGDVKENAAPGTGFLEDVCVQWERSARKAEDLGVRVVLMRTAFVVGAGAKAFRLLTLPFKLFAGGPFGSGEQWFSWIHVRDAVDGYIFALENRKVRGPVNLSSPNPVRVRELAKEIGKTLHRPSFMPAPSFALKAVLGEMSGLLLKGRRAIPAKLQDAGFTFFFPTVSEALRNVFQWDSKQRGQNQD